MMCNDDSDPDGCVLVSVTGRPAENTAAMMVVFHGSRAACAQVAALLPEGGSDMASVEHWLAVMPLAEWQSLRVVTAAEEA